MAPTTRAASQHPPSLDSSPVALPPARPRPLKRTASSASLPTPPRTLTRKKSHKSKAKSRALDTDTESDYSQASDGEDGVQQADRVVVGRKKRRTAATLSGHDEDEGSENEFWMGGAGAGTSSRALKASKSKPKSKQVHHAEETDGDSPPALLTYRIQSLVSPPPSHRKKATTSSKTPSTASTMLAPPSTPTKADPPVTPESSGPSTRSRARRVFALRDSPENPFLATDSESNGSPMSLGSSSRRSPRTPQRHEEKPFMTYVFRGMKAQFDNPLFNLPSTVHERSLLPVEHPDYEAEETCAPKLLFPSAHRRSRRLNTLDEEEPSLRTPVQKGPHATEGLRAGAVIVEKADVGERARGPVRKR